MFVLELRCNIEVTSGKCFACSAQARTLSPVVPVVTWLIRTNWAGVKLNLSLLNFIWWSLNLTLNKWEPLMFIGFSKLNQTTHWLKSIRSILFSWPLVTLASTCTFVCHEENYSQSGVYIFIWKHLDIYRRQYNINLWYKWLWWWRVSSEEVFEVEAGSSAEPPDEGEDKEAVDEAAGAGEV